MSAPPLGGGAGKWGFRGKRRAFRLPSPVGSGLRIFLQKILARGIRLKTSSWRRPAPDTAPVLSKAAGLYMICTLSKHQAEAEGYDDSLMLDWRGLLAEATGANLFLVIDRGFTYAHRRLLFRRDYKAHGHRPWLDKKA